MIDPRATVLRWTANRHSGGRHRPRRLVILEPGDRVPADLRLIRTRNLRIDEAALTGNRCRSTKEWRPPPPSALGDRVSMAFSGTFVASGTGTGVAVATGPASQLGRISTLVGTVETLTTPLIRQMDDLARKLTILILVGSAACSRSPCWCAITGRKPSW
jgi:magnesium-transporting ATPase (P-type)